MFIKKDILISVMVVMSAGLASISVWAGDEVLREKIETLISIRHPKSMKEKYLALGKEAPRVIQEMISDLDANSAVRGPMRRLALLQALGWFETEETAQFLEKQLEKQTDQSLLNQTVLRTLGGMAVSKSRTRLFVSYLSNSDSQTRIEAARALIRIQKREEASGTEVGKEIEKSLQDFQKAEKKPWVLREVQLAKQDRVPERVATELLPSVKQLVGTFKGESLGQSATLQIEFRGRFWFGRIRTGQNLEIQQNLRRLHWVNRDQARLWGSWGQREIEILASPETVKSNPRIQIIDRTSGEILFLTLAR